MKKIILFFLLFTSMIMFYTLLFPVKLYQKDGFYIDNYFSIDEKSQTNKSDGYFYYNNEINYFSIDSGMTKSLKTPDNQFIQANIYGYIIYNKVGQLISLFDTNGTKIKEIKSFGYPYISGDYPQFYILKTNGMGFSQYSMNGDELIKEINYTSLISAISTDKNGNSLISNLDGKTFLYSSKGEVIFNTDSEGNDSKAIIAKSNAIDPDGQYIAICSGLEPEYIEVFQKKTGTRISLLKTDTNFAYKIFMQIYKNKLYFEGEQNIKCFDIEKRRSLK